MRSNHTKDSHWTVNLEVTGYSVARPQKEVRGSGNTQVIYMHWNSSLNATYQVTDQDGRVHDGGNVSDKIEKGQPLAKPEDEAYRQYDLGLVYEAMSYEAKKFITALSLAPTTSLGVSTAWHVRCFCGRCLTEWPVICKVSGNIS